MGPRVREHHLQVIWGSVSQSLKPLAFPSSGNGRGRRLDPVGSTRGMFMGQAASGGPVCNPFDFHGEPHLCIFPSVWLLGSLSSNLFLFFTLNGKEDLTGGVA
jgi:hypothetical protein